VSVDQARDFIKLIRSDLEARKQFENNWRGRAVGIDDELKIEAARLVPPPLPRLAPDQKTDPEGNSAFWRRFNALKDMHNLLFEGLKLSLSSRPHNPYIQVSALKREDLIEPLQAPPVRQALEFLARLAAAITDTEIETDDMAEAYLGYLCWIFGVAPYPQKHAEVGRLAQAAAQDPELAAVFEPLTPPPTGVGLGHATLGLLSNGFSESDAADALVAALELLAQAAEERGYSFGAADYLGDRLARHYDHHAEQRSGRRAWEEGDLAAYKESGTLHLGLQAYA
jgi:hypothetical protein